MHNLPSYYSQAQLTTSTSHYSQTPLSLIDHHYFNCILHGLKNILSIHYVELPVSTYAWCTTHGLIEYAFNTIEDFLDYSDHFLGISGEDEIIKTNLNIFKFKGSFIILFKDPLNWYDATYRAIFSQRGGVHCNFIYRMLSDRIYRLLVDFQSSFRHRLNVEWYARLEGPIENHHVSNDSIDSILNRNVVNNVDSVNTRVKSESNGVNGAESSIPNRIDSKDVINDHNYVDNTSIYAIGTNTCNVNNGINTNDSNIGSNIDNCITITDSNTNDSNTNRNTNNSITNFVNGYENDELISKSVNNVNNITVNTHSDSLMNEMNYDNIDINNSTTPDQSTTPDESTTLILSTTPDESTNTNYTTTNDSNDNGNNESNADTLDISNFTSDQNTCLNQSTTADHCTTTTNSINSDQGTPRPNRNRIDSFMVSPRHFETSNKVVESESNNTPQFPESALKDMELTIDDNNTQLSQNMTTEEIPNNVSIQNMSRFTTHLDHDDECTRNNQDNTHRRECNTPSEPPCTTPSEPPCNTPTKPQCNTPSKSPIIYDLTLADGLSPMSNNVTNNENDCPSNSEKPDNTFLKSLWGFADKITNMEQNIEEFEDDEFLPFETQSALSYESYNEDDVFLNGHERLVFVSEMNSPREGQLINDSNVHHPVDRASISSRISTMSSRNRRRFRMKSSSQKASGTGGLPSLRLKRQNSLGTIAEHQTNIEQKGWFSRIMG